MNVACHDAIPIDFQTFINLAILYAFDDNASVLIANEDVDPINNSECYKV